MVAEPKVFGYPDSASRLAEAEGTGIPAAFHCEKIVAICHYLTGKNLLENRQNDGKMQKFFVRFAYGL